MHPVSRLMLEGTATGVCTRMVTWFHSQQSKHCDATRIYVLVRSLRNKPLSTTTCAASSGHHTNLRLLPLVRRSQIVNIRVLFPFGTGCTKSWKATEACAAKTNNFRSDPVPVLLLSLAHESESVTYVLCLPGKSTPVCYPQPRGKQQW